MVSPFPTLDKLKFVSLFGSSAMQQAGEKSDKGKEEEKQREERKCIQTEERKDIYDEHGKYKFTRGCTVFDEQGRYKFTWGPPKQNFRFTH